MCTPYEVSTNPKDLAYAAQVRQRVLATALPRGAVDYRVENPEKYRKPFYVLAGPHELLYDNAISYLRGEYGWDWGSAFQYLSCLRTFTDLQPEGLDQTKLEGHRVQYLCPLTRKLSCGTVESVSQLNHQVIQVRPDGQSGYLPFECNDLE